MPSDDAAAAKPAPRRPLRFVALLILPPLIAACFIVVFTVDVPFYDEWDLMDILLKEIAGVATLADYFTPHTVHRAFFSRLILVGLAKLTGWSVTAELWLNFATVVGTWLLLLRIVNSMPLLSERTRAVAYLLVSLTLFSLVQWVNFVWGWQLSWFLANFAFVAAVSILVVPGRLSAWGRIVVAGGCCIVSSFSVAHGLAAWFGAVPAIVVLGASKRERWIHSLTWIALTFASIAVYFKDFDPIAAVRPFSRTEALLYFVGMLGTPIVGHYPLNVVAGAVVGAAVCLVCVDLVRGRLTRWSVPWLGLAVYALLFAGVNAIGRVFLGAAASATSRYTSVTLLLVLAVVMLLLPELRRAREGGKPRSNWSFRVGATVLAASYLAVTATAPFAAVASRDKRRRVSLCRVLASAIPEAQSPCGPILHPWRQTFFHDFGTLRSAGYPGFPSLADLDVDAAPLADGGFFGERRTSGGSSRITGWLRGSAVDRPYSVILSRRDGTPVALTLIDANQGTGAGREIWSIDLALGLLPRGTEVEAWTMAWNGDIARLPGTFTVGGANVPSRLR